jgi:hypothetical protein
MNAGWNLRLRYGEKLGRLSREEEERRTAIAVEVSRKGSYSAGITAAHMFDLRAEYAEKRLHAFIDSIQELMELHEIQPSAEWKQKLLPELGSILKAVEVGLKHAKLGSNSPKALNAQDLQHEVETALAQIRERIQRRFDSMFLDKAAEEK